MKMYKRDEETGEVQSCNIDLEQRELMKGAGWQMDPIVEEESESEEGDDKPLTGKEKIAAAKAKAKE